MSHSIRALIVACLSAVMVLSISPGAQAADTLNAARRLSLVDGGTSVLVPVTVRCDLPGEASLSVSVDQGGSAGFLSATGSLDPVQIVCDDTARQYTVTAQSVDPLRTGAAQLTVELFRCEPDGSGGQICVGSSLVSSSRVRLRQANGRLHHRR